MSTVVAEAPAKKTGTKQPLKKAKKAITPPANHNGVVVENGKKKVATAAKTTPKRVIPPPLPTPPSSSFDEEASGNAPVASANGKKKVATAAKKTPKKALPPPPPTPPSSSFDEEASGNAPVASHAASSSSHEVVPERKKQKKKTTPEAVALKKKRPQRVPLVEGLSRNRLRLMTKTYREMTGRGNKKVPVTNLIHRNGTMARLIKRGVKEAAAAGELVNPTIHAADGLREGQVYLEKRFLLATTLATELATAEGRDTVGKRDLERAISYMRVIGDKEGLPTLGWIETLRLQEEAEARAREKRSDLKRKRNQVEEAPAAVEQEPPAKKARSTKD